MSAVLYEQSVVARINRKFRRMNLGSLQLRCKRGSAKYYLQHRPTEYILSHDIDFGTTGPSVGSITARMNGNKSAEDSEPASAPTGLDKFAPGLP